jgi:4-hydroxy-tetrahydrodipicolinate reductase
LYPYRKQNESGSTSFGSYSGSEPDRSGRALVSCLAIFGAAGRTGSRVRALAEADDRFGTVIPVGRSDPTPSPRAGTRPIGGIIDFSAVSGTLRAIACARDHRAALLVATTALDDDTLAQLDEAARTIPVLVAPNTSPGVAVLRFLAVEAARRLGKNFSIDVLESHHEHKKDAPSGTAIAIVNDLRQAGAELPDDRVRSIRAGDIVGEHEIQLSGPGEVLRLSHSATSRDVFAHGAIEATAWLIGQPAGRYTMEDWLSA